MKRLMGPMAALLLAGSAQAQIAVEDVSVQPARGGQGWSVLSGQTVGQDALVVAGSFGWPGISATLLKGATPKVDIGGRFSFNYGVEGIITQVTPGMKLQGVLRVALAESSRFNLGVNFAPGPFFYFYNRFTSVGLTLPVGVVLGIPAGSAVMLNVGMDFPMYVLFGAGGGVVFPILVGAGAEYFIDQRLSVSFQTRMGPSVISGYTAPFTLHAQIGVALKL